MRSDFWRISQLTIAALAAAVFLVAVQAADMTAADVASGLIVKGNEQWASGNPGDAQKAFELAVKADPRSVNAHMKLGGLQLSRNDFNGGIQTYQRVIGLDPKNVLAWIGLGISYLHSGRNELSRAAFDEAVRIDPSRKKQLASVMAKLNTAD